MVVSSQIQDFDSVLEGGIFSNYTTLPYYYMCNN